MMSNTKSLAEQIAGLSPEERAEFFKDFTQEEIKDLMFDWDFWARPDQTFPENPELYDVFLFLAGRGWGCQGPVLW